MKPAVVFGGPSPEHDISILTGLQVARTLVEGGIDAKAFYWTKSGEWYLVDPGLEAAAFVEGPPPKAKELRLVAASGGGFFERRKKLDVDVVLNACHGGPGEDGSLQAAFDLAGLRYTGPTMVGAALCMDKLAFAALMRHSSIPCLPRVAVKPGLNPGFGPPFITKPRFGGSSIGIEVVSDTVTAIELTKTSPHLRDGAVLEPFLADARDVLVGVRSYPERELSAFEAPARADDTSIYSYREKYLSGGGLEGSARELPARLSSGIENELTGLALKVAAVSELRSVSRIDFLVDGDRVWVNEVNTIPGSLAGYLWIDPPISRFELFVSMLEEAAKEPPRRFTAAGADGTALQTAASIAQKLG